MSRQFRIATTAMVMLLAALGTTHGTALADSGSYTAAGGESCTWFGSGSLYSISCSGYSRPAGGYVNYNCDLSIFGTSSSWRCRDSHGNSWSGSR